MTKPGTRIALWAAGAVAVTAVASLAIATSVGASTAVLTADDVARQLAADSSARASAPTVSAQPRDAAATGHADVFQSTPGTVVAACTGDMAVLESWSPSPGYRADDAVRGPAPTVSVQFESDTAADQRVIVTCEAGQPRSQVLSQDDDHGGDGGSGSGGSGSGSSGRDHPED